MSDIGKKLYTRRKQLKLTLEQVGDAVGVGKSTVRRWENGMIKNMGSDKITALARVLQMDPVELVPYDKPVGRIEVAHPTRLFAMDSMPSHLDPDGITNGLSTVETTVVKAGEKINGMKIVAPGSAEEPEDPELTDLMNMLKKATPARRKSIVRVIKAMYIDEGE